MEQDNDTDTVMAVTDSTHLDNQDHHSNFHHGKADNHKPTRAGSDSASRCCQICHRSGHSAQQCRASKHCSFCNKRGHYRRPGSDAGRRSETHSGSDSDDVGCRTRDGSRARDSSSEQCACGAAAAPGLHQHAPSTPGYHHSSSHHHQLA